MEPGEKTLEELQAEVLKLREEKEALETKNTALTQEKDKTKSSLDEARALNAKLWKSGVSTEGGVSSDPEPEPETQEQFIDSFIEPEVKRLKKIYGDEFVGNPE